MKGRERQYVKRQQVPASVHHEFGKPRRGKARARDDDGGGGARIDFWWTGYTLIILGVFPTMPNRFTSFLLIISARAGFADLVYARNMYDTPSSRDPQMTRRENVRHVTS